MAFNMGNRLRKFTGLRHAIKIEDWSLARAEMKYTDGKTKKELSPWHKKVKGRAKTLEYAMLYNKFPDGFLERQPKIVGKEN
jgi:hypothetical protein